MSCGRPSTSRASWQSFSTESCAKRHVDQSRRTCSAENSGLRDLMVERTASKTRSSLSANKSSRSKSSIKVSWSVIACNSPANSWKCAATTAKHCLRKPSLPNLLHTPRRKMASSGATSRTKPTRCSKTRACSSSPLAWRITAEAMRETLLMGPRRLRCASTCAAVDAGNFTNSAAVYRSKSSATCRTTSDTRPSRPGLSCSAWSRTIGEVSFVRLHSSQATTRCARARIRRTWAVLKRGTAVLGWGSTTPVYMKSSTCSKTGQQSAGSTMVRSVEVWFGQLRNCPKKNSER
mmetsp:Transcript_38450/g.107105  ORF Transcript_38450/g.107105 Transcript_38450/m.107105 type:complete len:292 (+) Transcript_38450:820-1695(+)